MRAVLLVLFLGLAACSAVPPEPLVPLRAGEGAVGITADLPVGDRRARTAGVSLWAGVGAGRGVDVAFSIDAPIAAPAELLAVLRGQATFVPPGLAVRKSFPDGLGVGLATASRSALFSEGGGFGSIAIGPFVTYGTRGEGAVAARSTLYLVHEVRETSADRTRRGLAIYGVGTAAGVARGDSSRTAAGGRLVVGVSLTRPHDPGLAVGPLVQAWDAPPLTPQIEDIPRIEDRVRPQLPAP